MGVSLAVIGLLASFLVSLGGAEEPQTFIIRVRNDAMPSVFASPEHWYNSTLRSITSSSSRASDRTRKDGFLHVYSTVFHGFSARITTAEANELKTRPGVVGVFSERVYHLHTTRSPQFLGLTLQSNLLKEADYGSNIVIGVVDSGIYPDRRSFHDHELGPVPARWKGECMEGPRFGKASCNRKIIGARFFPSGHDASVGRLNETVDIRSPIDTDGHGTHTASTAAGRLVNNVSLQGYASGDAVGVAPKARLAVYKVCWSNGCYTSDILAAIDKAVADGVDVLSLSVGSAPVPVFADPIAIGTFGAVEKGTFVSASGGNDGPARLTVTNTAPWITTVGASTIDRGFPADVILGDGTVITGSSVYGDGNFPAKQFFPLVTASNATRKEARVTGTLCAVGGLDPEIVRGKIVLCERGGVSRVTKGEAVRQAGGVGMILANVSPYGSSLVADSHVLPAVAVGEKEGRDVNVYIRREKQPKAAFVFHGTRLGITPAPTVAGFSSRGPNLDSPYIIKPDLLAPGVNILASWPGDIPSTGLASDRRRTEFSLMSGTSMSCPHVSGLAALLKGMHPDWSPAAIRSALMTTAYVVDNSGQTMVDETSGNTSDSWDFGSGQVNPLKAMNPGLVYDITPDGYINFLCSSNFSRREIRMIIRRPANCTGRHRTKPWNLNYPSISVMFSPGDGNNVVTVRRSVTNVADGPSSFAVTVVNPSKVSVSVSPSSLEFSEQGQKRDFVLRISAESLALPPGQSTSAGGALKWTDGMHTVRSPIAVTWQRPLLR